MQSQVKMAALHTLLFFLKFKCSPMNIDCHYIILIKVSVINEGFTTHCQLYIHGGCNGHHFPFGCTRIHLFHTTVLISLCVK